MQLMVVCRVCCAVDVDVVVLVWLFAHVLMLQNSTVGGRVFDGIGSLLFMQLQHAGMGQLTYS